jgi:hypothetical protein
VRAKKLDVVEALDGVAQVCKASEPHRKARTAVYAEREAACAGIRAVDEGGKLG